MQISELASLSGVSVHAIRHYESLGLIAAVGVLPATASSMTA
jgi:DNA-binding transcriptional MerR regulator